MEGLEYVMKLTDSQIEHRPLMREARMVARWRGHELGEFTSTRGDKWQAKCVKCGALATVVAHPAPNDVDISGTAVAVHCGDGLD